MLSLLLPSSTMRGLDSWTLLLLLLALTGIEGRIAFEKLTDLDYEGETYYTIRNLSLYECQGWCREEPECRAASFSFVVNPLDKSRQETICLLQNDTRADNPTSKPLRANNQYYMVKLNIRSDKVCKRPWNFERVPNAMIEGQDKALIFTSTKEACLAACLNERNFVCRSAEYNYVTLQCRLSDHDRRSLDQGRLVAKMVDIEGVDYFENLCLNGASACEGSRSFQTPELSVDSEAVARYVATHFYVDKELMANSESACERACAIESEFLCRSLLYLGAPTGADYNCKLYHMDSHTLPDGVNAFLNAVNMLVGDNRRQGRYQENTCQVSGKQPRSLGFASDETMLCKRVVTKDRRYITQITCYEKSALNNDNLVDDAAKEQNLGVDEGRELGNGGLTSLYQYTRRLAGDDAGDASETDGSDVEDIMKPMGGDTNENKASIDDVNNNDNNEDNEPNNGGNNNNNNGNNGNNNGNNNELSNGDNIGNNNLGGGNNNIDGSNEIDDVNCDQFGTCYDVTVHCKDTRIVVNVDTNRPFSGRVYALGRSETCNVDVINSNKFRLDLTMDGQDCNTQSANGVYTNTVVVQRHSVVMTKTDKIYKVRCTYDTSAKNITFGMMPIRDPDMISITSAPEAPQPRISILDQNGNEVETVRIGDKLTFKIAIPSSTPYGIFARSCVAMAKDSLSTFPIIDEDGCPVDPTIFPRFRPETPAALVSDYEAFRFTESYGVIFQCNVKYCLGPCPPARCGSGRDVVESFGRRRRRAIDDNESQTRLSREIIVLDVGDEQSSPYDNNDDIYNPHFNATDYRASPFGAWDESEAIVMEYEKLSCPTRTTVYSLLALCISLALVYFVTLVCMVLRRSNSQSAFKDLGRDYIR